MNIFTLLERLKVDSDQLQGMEVQEIQRLEKQLKLEQKMDASISTQIVEQLIEILRNHKDELVWVMQNNILRNIIQNQSVNSVGYNPRLPQGKTEIDIKNYIESYNLDDFRLFIDKCVQNNEWQSLNYLLSQKKYLPEVLLHQIAQKILQKIELGHAVLKNKIIPKLHQYYTNEEYIKEQIQSIVFLQQSEFYHIASQVKDDEIEDAICDKILNFIVDNSELLKKEYTFYKATFLAMASYKAMGESLSGTIERNYQVLNNASSYTVNQKEEGKSTKDTMWLVFKIVIGIIIVLARIGKCSSTHNSYNNQNNKSQSATYTTITTKGKVATYEADYLDNWNVFQQFLTEIHHDSIEVDKDSMEKISANPFFNDIVNIRDADIRNVPINSEASDSTIFYNKSQRSCILFFINTIKEDRICVTAQYVRKGESFMFLKRANLMSFDSLKVYTGKNLKGYKSQNITLLRMDKEARNEYRFSSFTDTDFQLYRKYCFESKSYAKIIELNEDNKTLWIEEKDDLAKTVRKIESQK